jgi:acetolactate synthase-1/2/3 large subunit
LVDITKDAQFGEAPFEYLPCTSIRSYQPKPKIDQDLIKEAADLINNAQRPYLLIGQGVILSEAERELMVFAERSGVPVASTLLGLGAFPSDHEQYVGYLGMHGNYAPNVLTNECDVLIAIGMRFDDRVTGDVDRYAKQAKVIHIDLDRSELNKIIKADVAINGDAKEVLHLLTPWLESKNHSEWLAEFRKLEEEEHESVIKHAVQPDSEDLRMAEVIHQLSEKSKPGTIIVTDVGQHQMITSRYFKYQRTRTNITSGGLGTMGFGLPAAIGAKLGAPEKDVVVVVGDGGIQMTIQEFGTIMQFNIGVKVLLLNNNFLGMVRQWQELFFDRRYSFTDIQNPDFVRIADGYHIPAIKIEDRSGLEDGLNAMLQAKSPFLLEVVVEKEDNVFPMMPTGASVAEIRLN